MGRDRQVVSSTRFPAAAHDRANVERCGENDVKNPVCTRFDHWRMGLAMTRAGKGSQIQLASGKLEVAMWAASPDQEQ